MSAVAEPAALPGLAGPRADPSAARPGFETLLVDSERTVFARTNRVFRWLLPGQWAFAVVTAICWSPVADRGQSPLAVALLAGGVLTLGALGAMRWRPYHLGTRLAVAMAQVGFSGLLIMLTGGRVETHFHIFGSMAFLALYRDWRVLPVATVAVVFNHVAAGLWWPTAVFGAPAEPLWRTAEYGGWLFFENAALIWSCLISRREMCEICRRHDEHQRLHDELEHRVAARTRDLEAEMKARELTAQELHQREQHHRNLISSLPIGIFETTQGGRIRFANPYLLGLIGLPMNFDPSAITLADGRIFSLPDRERFWRRLRDEGEVRGFAATFHHFDGSNFEVVINARLKPLAPGEELCCEGTLEDVSVRKRAERELDTLHGQLVIASRQAGMAEVASGVLHNVGNVLTSVNLIVHDVQDRLKTTRLSHLHRVVELMQREKPRLGEFFTTDPTGTQVPDFLVKLDQYLATENRQLLTDVEGLVRHFEHIREIIVTQQGSSQLFGVLEALAPAQLFEDALRLNAESLERHGISLERRFEPVGPVKADRHKVLQILVNLLKNAKDALQAIKPGERLIEVRVAPAGLFIGLSVTDNGPGIAQPNLTRIFQHGFTTKQSGHGFGLHSSVLAAREMGGDLAATSEGPGKGATFTLTLPVAKPAAP